MVRCWSYTCRAARVCEAEADLEAERMVRLELEREKEAFAEVVRQRDSEHLGSTREHEEIMMALQSQVDAANKVRAFV